MCLESVHRPTVTVVITDVSSFMCVFLVTMRFEKSFALALVLVLFVISYSVCLFVCLFDFQVLNADTDRFLFSM